jgi:hypothetical protein
MSSRQSRKGRAAAMAEAKRQALWDQGTKEIYSKWWRRLWAKISKGYRERNNNLIGRWFRRNVHRWSKEYVKGLHDPDRLEMERVAKKLRKQRMADRRKQDDKRRMHTGM